MRRRMHEFERLSAAFPSQLYSSTVRRANFLESRKEGRKRNADETILGGAGRYGNLSSGKTIVRSLQREPALLPGLRRWIQLLGGLWLE
jgi:hypothetical protein